MSEITDEDDGIICKQAVGGLSQRVSAHFSQADLCFLVQRVILGKQSNFLLYGTDMIMY